MKVLAIDPGKEGYICECDTATKQARVMPLPFRADEILCKKTFQKHFDLSKQSIIILEKISSNPKWAPASALKFGKHVGQLELLLADWPFRAIAPRHWQKDIHLGFSDNMPPKKKSLAAFIRINPNYKLTKKKINDNMVDSFLICDYALKTVGTVLTDWEIIEL